MLPVRISGLAEGEWPLANGTEIAIDGTFIPWQATTGLAVANGAQWAEFLVPERLFDRVKNSPVRVYARVNVMLVSRTGVTNLPPGSRATRVPGVGLCTVTSARLVECFSPLGSSFWTIAGFGTHTIDNLRILHGCCGVSPGFTVWSLSLQFDPLQDRPDVSIESYTPTAHFEREFEIPAIVLADYEVARRRR